MHRTNDDTGVATLERTDGLDAIEPSPAVWALAAPLELKPEQTGSGAEGHPFPVPVCDARDDDDEDEEEEDDDFFDDEEDEEEDEDVEDDLDDDFEEEFEEEEEEEEEEEDDF